MELGEVAVEPVAAKDEGRYRRLMGAHHYLGALPKIGETLWYGARWRGEWVALAGFSAPALKCGARDRWIGWDFRTQYDRQHLLANNSRFLILPGRRVPNRGSRVLALCGRRLTTDWPARFGHPLLLLETFVDPARFRGTVYRAANWTCVGRTRGFRRVRGGYSAVAAAPKLVFVRPLVPDARARLTRPALDPADRHGGPKAMISADTMRSLPDCFADIDDPRRRQGRRHPLPTVLAIAAGATLCGARGYRAMAEWAEDLSPRARERFRCRHRSGRYDAAVETGTLSVAAAVLMKAGFGSRNGAVKAVADGEAKFEDLSGLLRWVRSGPVVELGQDPDWPTAETHELWTTFVGGLGIARAGRWRKSYAKVPVQWFDAGLDRGGLPVRLSPVDGRTTVCSASFDTLGEADVSLPVPLQGVLRATVSDDGAALDVSYIGPEQPFGAGSAER